MSLAWVEKMDPQPDPINSSTMTHKFFPESRVANGYLIIRLSSISNS